jgi:hypothetical protein
MWPWQSHFSVLCDRLFQTRGTFVAVNIQLPDLCDFLAVLLVALPSARIALNISFGKDIAAVRILGRQCSDSEFGRNDQVLGTLGKPLLVDQKQGLNCFSLRRLRPQSGERDEGINPETRVLIKNRNQ